MRNECKIKEREIGEENGESIPYRRSGRGNFQNHEMQIGINQEKKRREEINTKKSNQINPFTAGSWQRSAGGGFLKNQEEKREIRNQSIP